MKKEYNAKFNDAKYWVPDTSTSTQPKEQPPKSEEQPQPQNQSQQNQPEKHPQPSPQQNEKQDNKNTNTSDISHDKIIVSSDDISDNHNNLDGTSGMFMFLAFVIHLIFF
ncbi:hypothetical protein, conserved [Entamoeba histolytica]